MKFFWPDINATLMYFCNHRCTHIPISSVAYGSIVGISELLWFSFLYGWYLYLKGQWERSHRCGAGCGVYGWWCSYIDARWHCGQDHKWIGSTQQNALLWTSQIRCCSQTQIEVRELNNLNSRFILRKTPVKDNRWYVFVGCPTVTVSGVRRFLRCRRP